MTKKEIKEWMNTHKLVDIGWEESRDDNRLTYNIFEVDRQLYRVDFCNGCVSEKWITDKGYVRGVYEPHKVKKESRMVEVVKYNPIKEDIS